MANRKADDLALPGLGSYWSGIDGAADYLRNAPMMPMKTVWETQAELYMEGLQAQVAEIEKTLKPDQELHMICWQGHDKMKVLQVSMPSHNVVALTCVDSEGATVQVTGHMNSITFSFRVVTATPPVTRNRIGFDMP